jgi:hypothetical protein
MLRLVLAASTTNAMKDDTLFDRFDWSSAYRVTSAVGKGVGRLWWAKWGGGRRGGEALRRAGKGGTRRRLIKRRRPSLTAGRGTQLRLSTASPLPSSPKCSPTRTWPARACALYVTYLDRGPGFSAARKRFAVRSALLGRSRHRSETLRGHAAGRVPPCSSI